MVTVVLDISGWTQSEVNQIQAACVSMLHESGVTYSKLRVSNGVLHIEKPSSNPGDILDGPKVKARIYEQEKVRKETFEREVVERKKLEQAYFDSGLKGATLSVISAKIDGISSLEEAKVVLKALCAYVGYTTR